jgi:ABC-type Fe3+-hydroxamate transport system substrate-binding protein
MHSLKRQLLLAFVPAILLLAACGDAGAVSDNNSATSPVTAAVVASPTPTHAVKPKPVVKPKPKPVAAAPYAAAKAAGATAVCADGSWSYSAHRSGTCSSHGGVHWWTGNLGAAGPGAH